MAMATPIAPSTIATRQIRLRIAVAFSSPWLNPGLPSRKSITCASGSAASTCLRSATGSACGGSFISSRWVARLPVTIRPVRCNAACEIITLGPNAAAALRRSGSWRSTAAMRKLLPPSRSVWPTRAFSRIRNSSATTAESPSKACGRLIAGSNAAAP